MLNLHQGTMSNARKLGFVVGIIFLFLLAVTRAWTTMSPATIGRNAEIKQYLPCIQMTNSESEGGSNSYEDQYNSFANQKKQEKGPRIVPQPNQADGSPTKVHLPNAKRVDPIQKKTSKNERDRKAQEELEMAFLEFISCYPTKKGPQMKVMKPPKQQQSREPGLYDDISTTLDFQASPKHVNENLGESVIDVDINEETEPSASVSASLSTDSDPSEDDNDNVIIANTKVILDSNPPSSDHIITSSKSTTDNDNETRDDDATSKRQSLSASNAYEKEITGEILNSDIENIDEIMNANGINYVGDSVVKSYSDPPEFDIKPDDKYFTIDVKVETTFPEEITVEDAKTGWLEFCWAKGGGIVVPVATSTTPSSASSSTNVDDAPASIKFESEESKTKARQKAESASATHELSDIPAGIPSARELIVPLGLKQELVSSTSTLDEIQKNTIRRDVITYKTTQRGFFCKDMIEGSHEGKVEFIGASYTSTRMIWTVTFQVEEDEASSSASPSQESSATRAASNVIEFASNTKTMVEDYSKQFMDSNPGLKTMMSKANLWGSWSQFQLKTASQNLIAYLDNSVDSIPVMEHTETLPVGISPREAMEIWYDYYWKNGGGSLPVIMSPAKGSDKRWVIPSGLEEELVSLEYDHPVSESVVVGVDGKITTETEIAKAVYKVNNPNLLTFPVYHHRATVRFVRDGEANPTQLFWKVKVKPYRKFLGNGVMFWTKNGISLAAKNLRNYIELKQLEQREKELQAQLERLRVQKPDSGTGSIKAHSDKEGDDNSSPEDFRTVRSTLSISSVQSSHEANLSRSIRQSNNENDTTNKNDKVLQTPTSSSYTRAMDKSVRGTMAIPPHTVDDGTTIPFDSHTHAVDDEIDKEFWQ